MTHGGQPAIFIVHRYRRERVLSHRQSIVEGWLIVRAGAGTEKSNSFTTRSTPGAFSGPPRVFFIDGHAVRPPKF